MRWPFRRSRGTSTPGCASRAAPQMRHVTEHSAPKGWVPTLLALAVALGSAGSALGDGVPVTGRRPNLSRTGRSAQRPTPAGPWCRTQEELEEASAKSAAGQDANARNAPSEVGGACVGRALSTAGAGADDG